jgi:hypothetical protein
MYLSLSLSLSLSLATYQSIYLSVSSPTPVGRGQGRTGARKTHRRPASLAAQEAHCGPGVHVRCLCVCLCVYLCACACVCVRLLVSFVLSGACLRFLAPFARTLDIIQLHEVCTTRAHSHARTRLSMRSAPPSAAARTVRLAVLVFLYALQG